MQDTLFCRLGKCIYKYHILIILLWIVLILSCIPFIPHMMSPFKSTGFIAENSRSATADNYLDKKLGYSYNSLVILYTSKTLLATHAPFIQEIKQSLSELKDFSIKHQIIYPDTNKKQISKDKHTAYVVILFDSHVTWDHDLLNKFHKFIKEPKHMSMLYGGQSVFVEDVNKQTQKDLYKADLIETPVSIITLILVFGSLVAGVVPVVLGGGCALIMLTTLYFIGHICTLSIFTLNIALLLGLCLSLDYSLFIISRFRAELSQHTNIVDVICVTLATAGRAVFFSGLAVFISLSALLLFPVNILFSVGIGGLTAVFVAVSIAILLLPAILVTLKSKINSFPVRIFKKKKPNSFHFWSWLAKTVIHQRVFFFLLIMFFLLMLGYPFLNARFGVSDVHILPKQTESREFFDVYKAKFNERELTPIRLIVTTKHESILSENNISKLYQLTSHLKHNPLISTVNSIVTTEPRLQKNQYYALYHSPLHLTNASIHSLLKTTTREHFTIISIVGKYNIHSPQMKTLIAELRQLKPIKGFSMQLTGVPVRNEEVLNSIGQIFPYALLWIVALTYLILLILLRSIFLPLKAILMNVLSLCASYGVLVFVFQEWHFHQLLNFSPQGIVDISLLVIIFCALFGFSMDYEVFLLTRIKEFYDKCHDNNKSIIFGIEQSSRIITSAAIIVICICGSFMVAEVLLVKEFGLGIAVAIFIDAFCIRTILVPATMALVKQWNWYLPAWLDKILPK